MTVIKQVAITSKAHLKNLARYLDDERFLMRGSQYLVDERRWSAEMDSTRRAYGHNSTPRGKNTFMFHQIIAFNPDECSMNGGPMAPKDCMEFAKEWIEKRYPHQEAVYVLHREHCNADGTDRFAVHIGINRTDLQTGLRLNEGPSRYAKVERANAMRDMDKRWGLSQLQRGMRNSQTHSIQPTKAEEKMAARGMLSDKEFLRQRIRVHTREIAMGVFGGNRMRELARRLEKDGITMSRARESAKIMFQSESGYRMSGHRLGEEFRPDGLERDLQIEHQLDEERGMGLDA